MMVLLAAISLGAAVLGTSFVDTPDPVPLTDVQREMIVSGQFEPDSFQEPAFEALVENVRSWPEGSYTNKVISLQPTLPETFAELCEREPGALMHVTGTVMLIDPLGDVFPGVTRVTIEMRYGTPKNPSRGAMLVFLIDEEAPEIGSKHFFMGRLYKLMELQTQHSDSPTAFPAIVAHTFDYEDPSEAEIRENQQMKNTGAAIITALTGALAVVFFIVIMGRHMLGANRPQRRPLASADNPSDDLTDAE